jgi:hypothetical protein
MADEESALPPARYERQDLTFTLLVLGFFGTLAFLLFSALLIMWIYPSAMVDQTLAGSLPAYPEPRLQADPDEEMRRFLKAELTQLNSSGWIDQANGIAHIPIDEAMRRLAQQGIPDWPTQGGSP